MPRTNIQPRHQRRDGGAITEAWEQLLLLHCGRVGVFLFLQGHREWIRLMNDRQYRDQCIREIWREHADELQERWTAEHPGVEPSVLRYLAKTPAIQITRGSSI